MELYEYVKEDGEIPFETWLESLDITVRARVRIRLNRLRLGNIGDHKFIAKGVGELRMTFGGGCRVYYGMRGKEVVILLAGGDKDTQQKDIRTAMKYWQDYLSCRQSEHYEHS